MHFHGIITSQQSQPHMGPNNGIFPGRFFAFRLLCQTNKKKSGYGGCKYIYHMRTSVRKVCGFKVSLWWARPSSTLGYSLPAKSDMIQSELFFPALLSASSGLLSPVAIWDLDNGWSDKSLSQPHAPIYHLVHNWKSTSTKPCEQQLQITTCSLEAWNQRYWELTIQKLQRTKNGDIGCPAKQLTRFGGRLDFLFWRA